MFLGGLFLQALSSYYALVARYVKMSLSSNTVKVLSLLGILGTISFPINTTIAGHITHTIGWQYVFAHRLLMILFCLLLTIFLPTNKSVNFIKLSFKSYKNNLKFFITNKHFNKSLFLYAAVGGASSIFYTLSPHIMMTDFHLSSSLFGLLLFMPTIGTLIGSFLTYYWTEKLSINGNILAGKCIAIFGMVLFVIIFYFFQKIIL